MFIMLSIPWPRRPPKPPLLPILVLLRSAKACAAAEGEGGVHLSEVEEEEEEEEESGDWRKPVALLRVAKLAPVAPLGSSNNTEDARRTMHNRRAMDEGIGSKAAPLGKRRQAAAGEEAAFARMMIERLLKQARQCPTSTSRRRKGLHLMSCKG
jgi:hypothetical protein